MAHKGKLQYHLVWCTKYRRRILTEPVQERLKELITEKCKENGYDLISIEAMPDHVHVFCSADANTSVNRLVSQLKGYLSFNLRKEFKHLVTKVPSLWTRSYFAGSIGEVSATTVIKYIENQKGK